MPGIITRSPRHEPIMMIRPPAFMCFSATCVATPGVGDDHVDLIAQVLALQLDDGDAVQAAQLIGAVARTGAWWARGPGRSWGPRARPLDTSA